MIIRRMNPADIPDIVRLWNNSVRAGEVVYRPIDEAYFNAKFLCSSGYYPELSLVAEQEGVVVGYINGTMKREFLRGQTHDNTPGCLTVIFVDAAFRGKGIGSDLLKTLEDNARIQPYV